MSPTRLPSEPPSQAPSQPPTSAPTPAFLTLTLISATPGSDSATLRLRANRRAYVWCLVHESGSGPTTAEGVKAGAQTITTVSKDTPVRLPHSYLSCTPLSLVSPQCSTGENSRKPSLLCPPL